MLVMSVIIYVIIYVIKMSDDEAVDIAVAVTNALRIYFWRNYRSVENLIKSVSYTHLTLPTNREV